MGYGKIITVTTDNWSLYARAAKTHGGTGFSLSAPKREQTFPGLRAAMNSYLAVAVDPLSAVDPLPTVA